MSAALPTILQVVGGSTISFNNVTSLDTALTLTGATYTNTGNSDRFIAPVVSLTGIPTGLGTTLPAFTASVVVKSGGTAVNRDNMSKTMVQASSNTNDPGVRIGPTAIVAAFGLLVHPGETVDILIWATANGSTLTAVSWQVDWYDRGPNGVFDALASASQSTGSMGKSLGTGVAPGADGGLMISGTNAGTVVLGALTVTGATTLTGNVTFGGAFTLPAATVQEIWDFIKDGDHMWEHMIYTSALSHGRLGNANAATEDFKNRQGTQPRVSIANDGAGNRTGITVSNTGA